ncbi:hypothetical protein AGMMS50268_03760 [Spirochaetia bacterium]|nr:hypothetical protein AGMMS50268_03760 [Spirochaetia bacterium]
MKTIFVDLFAGIGGFALGAYWSGLQIDEHYFSEIDPYAITVYQKRFPNAVSLGNIKKIDGVELCKKWTKENQGEPAQVLMTGGFP